MEYLLIVIILEIIISHFKLASSHAKLERKVDAFISVVNRRHNSLASVPPAGDRRKDSGREGKHEYGH